PALARPYVLLAAQESSRCATVPSNLIPNLPTTTTPICAADEPSPIPLLAVNVTGTPATGNQAQFIPAGELKTVFPPFLQDITDAEVTGTKTVVFESVPTTGGPPFAMHTVNGHKFDGNLGEVVMLTTVDEWKLINSTINGAVQNGKVVATDPPGIVDHPFHIHINPFQIVEFFDPNELLPGTSTYKYVFVKST